MVDPVSYAVTWAEDEARFVGHALIVDRGLRLEGRDANAHVGRRSVRFDQIVSLETRRTNGHRSLLLELAGDDRLVVTSLDRPGSLGELTDRLRLLTDRPQRRRMTGIDLYWLPLGAGGHSVRLNGRVYEALVAWTERRKRHDLYHAALEVRVPEGRFVVEMTPNRADAAAVVADGAVGARLAGRFRLFRYEVRRWRDGVIPDVAEAVESPRLLSDDLDCARRLLELVPLVPTPIWGRDELRTGEMWNSNSLVSWLIARTGLDVESIHPPRGGRAPGWRAGIVVARRQRTAAGVGTFVTNEHRPRRPVATAPRRSVSDDPGPRP
ncbi:MAG TPA: hypothetical protein VFP31_10495 [Gaiellaceae bacterium]|nr:hypothetical protein [Gaiellaceae bacterium]